MRLRGLGFTVSGPCTYVARMQALNEDPLIMALSGSTYLRQDAYMDLES